MNSCEPEVIYLDKHLLVVNKPAGILVQRDRTGDTSLLEICKKYIKKRFKKPGNVYLGLVHRLDRPASGVIIFARTSKSASRLSRQFREGEVEKLYWVMVEGKVPEEGHIVDWIERRGPQARIVARGRGKSSRLFFTRLFYSEGVSLVEVKPITGRHHQLRVQFATRAHPVLGDVRYGSHYKFARGAIALHARAIAICHPILKRTMTFTSAVHSYWRTNSPAFPFPP